jgi:ABC-type uncharacterized transport system involved in gliding motility auxiliary subunit
MTALAGALQKNYEIQVVNIAIGQFIDKDIDALFIIKPLFAYSDWTLFALDQYIMNGGRVGFLVNMIEANLQEASARRNTDLNLEEFTKNLGFRIVPDLVYDQKCGMINIQQRQGFFTITNAVPYPFFPIIRNFNRDIAITKGLEDLPLYFPSSVESTVDSTDSVIFKPLCWTSNKSNRMVGRYEINPTMGGFRQMTFPDSAIMVAATLTGKFTSYFNDRPLPLQEDNKPYTGEVLRQSSETRLVAIGEGNFVTDKFLASRSSADFFLNLVDWLAQDESLIHIRTREVTTRPLIDTSQGVKGAVKYANIFAPAILVIVIGIVRWQIRRKFKPEL